jgi:subfamily B ATP-binding cassette protein MsbA
MRAYFQKILEILGSFEKFLGFRMYVALAFSAIASVIDGLGITLLMPLLTVISGEDLRGGSQIDQIVSHFLTFLSFPTDSVFGILALLSVVFILKGIILFSALFSINQLKAELLRTLKHNVLEKMRATGVQTYIERGSGYYVNILNEQTNRSILAFHALSHLMMHALNVAIYLSLAFSIAWRFGISSMLLGIFVVQLFRHINARVQSNSIEISKNNERINQAAINLITGFKYLKATAQVSGKLDLLKSHVERLKKLERVQGILSAVTLSVREPLVIVSLSAIILFQVEYLGQEVTPMLVSIVLFYRCMNSILQMQGYLQNTLETYGSFIRVSDFLNESEDPKTEELRGNYVGVPNSTISLDSVSVQYDGHKVLDDISFQFEENKWYCLVGKSGSGKTTLVDVILGLVPLSSGRVLLPQSVSRKPLLNNLRESVGYVSQESVLFDGSIAENVSGKKSNELTEEEERAVYSALSNAGFDDFKKTFLSGLDTILGERGTNLSGGQRQRLFLARELYRNPNVLILDEATSALDQSTERLVNQNLLALKGKLTIILITHRLSSVAHADEILILDKGKIRAHGSYETLKQTDSQEIKEHLMTTPPTENGHE